MRHIFIVFLLFSTTNVYAWCGKEKARGHEYTFCIDAGEDPNETDILYYLHGGGGSERGWEKSGYNDIVVPRWSKLKYKRPAVITVSFGPQWLLSDMVTAAHPALLNAFAEEIIPKLEQFVPGKHQKRMLLGASMGGYNGAQLALRYPDLWDRVALMCPGLGVTYPFQSDEEIEKFITTLPKSINPDLVRGITAWVRREFVSAQNWDRHDPQQLADMAMAPLPAYFVSCSKDDEYGFYDMAKRFHDVMAGKTSAVWSSVETGGHCSLDEAGKEGLAKFLAGR